MTQADALGDEGLNTRRNDRDVVLLDVNGDSWLHMVAAVVCGGWSGLPKHITHPRSHINLRGDPPAPGN